MAANTRSVDNVKYVLAATLKNYTGAAMTAKYVSLKNYNHITIIIQTGAWAAGTAAVTLLQASDVSATGAKALAVAKMWTSTLASDTLAENTVTSNTFNLDTADTLYIIEIDAATLDVSNGFDCLTLAVASPGANADFYGVQYRLSGARYAQAALPSAIVD